jgi:hypothetical protein
MVLSNNTKVHDASGDQSEMLTVHPTPHLFPLNNSAKYKASKLPAKIASLFFI